MTTGDDPEQNPDAISRDTLLWVHVEVTRNVLVQHLPELEDQGRWPAWSVVGANMALALARFDLAKPADVLPKLRANAELQDVVLSAYRMGASHFELFSLLTEWPG